MPKQTRSIEEIEEVKEAILQQALDILVEEGFENLSMHKVGARLKMTAANLYNYYANKDELIIAIHKKTFGMLYGRILNAVAPAKGPADKINSLIAEYVRFGVENPAFYDVMFNRRVMQFSDYIGTAEEDISFDEYQSSLKSLVLAFGIVGEYLQAIPDGTRADARFVTIRVLAQLHGIISLYNSRILHEMIESPDEVVEKITGEIIAGLGAHGSRGAH